MQDEFHDGSVLLCSGWSEKLTAAVAPATDGRTTENTAATKLPATIEPVAPRVATATPAIQGAAATNLVLERTDFLDPTADIANANAPPAESRHQGPLLRRSSRGHGVDLRWLPTWDAVFVAFEDTTTSGAAQI